MTAKHAGIAGAITPAESREQLALKEKIRTRLTGPVVQAVLQDSGLFPAEDFAKGRITVSDHGLVTLRDVSQVTEANLAAARRYIDGRQATRQADGSWKSHAEARSQQSWAAAKA